MNNATVVRPFLLPYLSRCAPRLQLGRAQTSLVLSPKQVIIDLAYRSVDADNPGVQIIHRGKYKALTDEEKPLPKRRQAIAPLIGHTKADHRMDRCWVQGAVGDALKAMCSAADYNIRWLWRAITRLGLRGHLCALSAMVMCVVALLGALLTSRKTPGATARTAPIRLSAVTPLRLDAAV